MGLQGLARLSEGHPGGCHWQVLVLCALCFVGSPSDTGIPIFRITSFILLVPSIRDQIIRIASRAVLHGHPGFQVLLVLLYVDREEIGPDERVGVTELT